MTTFADRKPLHKIKDDVKFYQHQVEGVRHVWRKGSMMLCDEMGLGKSLQALTIAAIDFERNKAQRLLIVSPASLKWNWLAEIEKFTHFTAVVLDGSPKARAAQLNDFASDVMIVNYEQVVAHHADLNAIGFQVIVMDEAHYIKGYDSKRTQACQKLVARRYLLLTGSPVLNHIDDLWSLLWMIDPKSWPNYHAFKNRYCVMGGYKKKEIIGVKNKPELTARTQSLMLRRLKKDVLDLPDKLHVPIIVDLHPLQEKLYSQALKELMIDLPDDPENPMELENALTKMLRLKQICGTTATIEGYEDKSDKLDVGVQKIMEVLESGEHFVVWTQFRAVLACLENRLLKHDVPLFQLHGDVPHSERSKLLNNWADAPEPAVLGSMLQVGGVGLNMTAARKCLFLDKLYAPKLNEQAEDRIHRIGASTTQPVEILHTYCRGTIEDRIEEILRSKIKVFKDVIDTDDDAWAKQLLIHLREKEAA